MWSVPYFLLALKITLPTKLKYFEKKLKKDKNEKTIQNTSRLV